jgi:hypothetical protein
LEEEEEEKQNTIDKPVDESNCSLVILSFFVDLRFTFGGSALGLAAAALA